MSALSADRDTPRRDGRDYAFPVAAGAVCHAGAIACLDASGHATPGASAAGLTAVGRFVERVEGGAVAGAVSVLVETGVFRYAAAEAIDRTAIGAEGYIVDDQTVSLSDGGGTRSRAGRIVDVEPLGVWIRIGV
ncbi:hypothetical protein L0E83_11470 [Marichromatium gracile]|uniref:hypothetical protein n=1 Tax=Marichromatium gracile TaxID=1048 RepID=UPI001F37031A|nr:hypothetical protein [Marichromatium gracile]MCF1184049.1 hypothetical protein [Marichromatium gracile]